MIRLFIFSFNSVEALTKFIQLSDPMIFTMPLLEISCLMEIKKECVDNSLAISK